MGEDVVFWFDGFAWSCGGFCSGAPAGGELRSRQSLRLVLCPCRAVRSALVRIASVSPSFPLAMADEGPGKGMSLSKT